MLKLDALLSEIRFSFARSSGPGGQNVNKVNSKVILRWNLLESGSPFRDHLLRKLNDQLTIAGEIVIKSDRFRDQAKNKKDCIEKFGNLITRALAVPKVRKKTKPSRSSRIQKKENKSRQSNKKRSRSKAGWE